MTDTINRIARKIPVWAIWIIYLLPVPWLLYLAMTGGLGREPIEALEHELGEIAIQLLIIGLAITPLRRFLNINLLKFRRAIGLLAFTYVVLHVLVWAILDVQVVSQMWADILKRPYVTVGMAATLLMVPLAVTSNNASVRRLGAKWRSLHKLVYPAVLLAAIHFLWVRKGLQLEPILYMGVILFLILLRMRWISGRKPSAAG